MPNTLICLCGSTRFLAEFNIANVELTKRGLSIVTISMALPKDEITRREPKGTEGLKELLDLVHLNKILRADAVLVIGDGYIGRSTAREILWAEMQSRITLFVEDYRVGKEHDELWDDVADAIRDPLADTTSYTIMKARQVLGL